MITTTRLLSHLRERAVARFAFGMILFFAFAAIAQTQTSIKTDASWGREARTIAPSASATSITSANSGKVFAVPGSIFTIPQSEGRVAGSNLFHSFEHFSIGSGDAALFTTQAASLQNVIGRVSGSAASTINGLLTLQALEGGKPNLFIVNPAGIAFGAGAQIDVPAAFHVSTANSLNFADGTTFKAGQGTDSTLTIAAPEAFGFVGQQRISVVSFGNTDAAAAAQPRVNIELSPGASFGITSGAVQFASADVSVPEGVLRVGATGNATVEVPVSGAGSTLLSGPIDVNDATLTTTGTGAIQLAGGEVRLNRSAISGNTGSVNVTADTLSMSEGARITTEGRRPANADSMTINTNHLSLLSGSQINSSSSGAQQNAGSANITIQGRQGSGSLAQSLLVSGNNTIISTDTTGAGQGGNIQIAAQEMTVEQLANLSAETSSRGTAGNITMTGGSLAVLTGGRIEASTSGEGNGGSIAVTTSGDVTVTGVSADRQTRSGLFAKTLTPTGGAGAGGGGAGGGGGGGGGGGAAPKPGTAGNIAIISKNLALNDGAQIDSSTTSGGAGGDIEIKAAEQITIAGGDTRLTSDATRGDGPGGGIHLIAKNVTVQDGASVTAATGGKGDAGNITLSADDQLLLQAGGTITTSTSGSGNGGTIVVRANRVMLDGPGSVISADTLRPFADLTVTINVLHPNNGDLVVQLDTPSGTRVALLSRVGGSGDDFTDTKFDDQAKNPITAGSAPFNGTFQPREPLAQLINELVTGNWVLNVRDQATGNVGSLRNWVLQIGQQTFQSTGSPRTIPDNGILRSTIAVANPISQSVLGTGEASGNGGDVSVSASSVTVQNGGIISAITRGSGKGGIVTVEATGPVVLSDAGTGAAARIATDTLGTGPAGNVLINARNLEVSASEVSSNSSGSSSGNAGSIDIDLEGPLTLVNAGAISSSTKSIRGAAGSIESSAEQILVDGQGSAILADALENSSGQTGSLTVNAAGTITLSNGGALSIRNEALVDQPSALTPTLLSVFAPNITLKDGKITAESSGNANASDIDMRFTRRLIIDPSSIETSANQGNAGDISIAGGQTILLQDSQITTSVLGSLGNGGDISIHADSLVMQSGFIQANTAGVGASGGNVNIDVRTLLPSGDSVLVGGSTPFVFQPGVFGPNVIQAAAPTGVSGTISTTTPTLDVAGRLSRLAGELFDFAALARDPCRMGATSSFTRLGRGGLRPASTGMIRSELAQVRPTHNGEDRVQIAAPNAQQHPSVSRLSECGR